MSPSDDNRLPKWLGRETSGNGTSGTSPVRARFFYVAVSVIGALAITAFVVPAASASTARKGVWLSSNPLGVNVAPWQTANLNGAARQRMENALKQLGSAIAVRYGGGVFADADNQLIGRNTNVISQAGHQTSNFWGDDSHRDALTFSAYAAEARTVHANVMVTINYGTGTPALAGAWLASIRADHDPVTAVEIGNEPYGCSSPDKEITEGPVWDTSYEPNVPSHCPYSQYGGGSPGIKQFARSFLAHAPAFIRAVHKADPAVKVVVPYAISPPGDGGHVWNHEVMAGLGDYQGINVLWYPSHTWNNPSSQTALTWLTQIPARAAAIKDDLRKYAPSAFWMIGEENIANHPTWAVCTPMSAVFAAASALAWLAEGARNVNWWGESDGNNSYGHCRNRDFSMFDLTGYPLPPYKGFLLASKLAQPHAVLSTIDTGNSDVLAYHATLTDGRQAVALININAGRSERVSGPAIGGGTLTQLQYTSEHTTIAQTQVPSWKVKTIRLPKDSVTVFTN
jgi:hypothetical protein